MRSLLLLLFSFLICLSVKGQGLDISFEFQAYPTGLIPGLRLEKSFNEKNAVHLRLGYQIIDHRDLGVQTDEKGSGYGFSLGYKRYFQAGFNGWFLGARTDLWFNTLDWENLSDFPPLFSSGTTKVTVVQPTLEGGYRWSLGESGFIAPTVAFGFEVNVKTEGADVGEGPILLLGFLLGKSF